MTETLFSHLIPISVFKTGFTTCKDINHGKIHSVDLVDRDLGVHKVSSKTTHNLVKPPHSKAQLSEIPEPSLAWEAFYAKGSINPSSDLPGGFGFYLSGPNDFARQLETATEAVFSYRLMLEDGWEWVKGGKLPGIFGGAGTLSYNCSGGRQDQRCQCFNIRPMWRAKGVGELYTYLPLTAANEEVLKKVPPRSTANNDYGFSVGRGSFDLERSVACWTTYAFRIKLNSPGQTDGELQMWVDGTSVINVAGLKILDLTSSESDGKLKGMHFQTFFGGHTEEWASTKDQRAWFADLTAVIVQ